MEVGGYGIRVNGVTPGPVEGPRITRIVDYKSKTRGISREEVIRGYSEDGALDRFLRPEEIASAILFLCSDESSGITGQIVRVDGGADLGPWRRDISSVVLPGVYPHKVMNETS
jgi:NAD(P)-dependent dehydrogenase (short-subunit alcohol dehydrogenase family)